MKIKLIWNVLVVFVIQDICDYPQFEMAFNTILREQEERKVSKLKEIINMRKGEHFIMKNFAVC
jgi:hypothetical protein